MGGVKIEMWYERYHHLDEDKLTTKIYPRSELNREEIIGGHSLGELRVRICDSAWNADDRICYVRVAEGCRRCVSSRPTTDEWRAHVAEHPQRRHNASVCLAAITLRIG